MPGVNGPLAVDLVTAALILTALYARLTVVLGVLVATVVLIPSTLVVPHLHTSYATVNHVVIGAAAIRLAAMAWHGTMARERFGSTPLHLALVLLIAAWGFAGIVFAPASEQPVTAAQRIIGLAFVAIFFVVCLALIRELEQPWLVMRLLTVTLVITAGIALIERVTGDSWGHWLFQTAGHPGPTDAAHVLETRAGHVRVRASAEFALAYAWIALMLLPVATVVVLRMRRRWILAGLLSLAAVVAAIYFTYSRSAAAAVPAVLVLLALAVRERRTIAVGALAAATAGIVYAATPTIRHHLSLSVDQGSVGIRFQRLPPILAAVTHHAFLGLGLGGLQTIGVTNTDNFYLTAYAETGVVGAAVLVALCLTGIAQSARGIALRDVSRRAIAGACAVGFVAFLASGAFDDALQLNQPAELAFLLLAVATATAEPVLGTPMLPKWSPPRIAILTGAGALVGLVAYLAAPVVVSQERTFTTVSPLAIVFSGESGVAPDLIKTVCDLSKAVQSTEPGTHFSCRDDYLAPGVGTLRVESPSTSRTLQAYTALTRAAHRAYYLGSFQTFAAGAPIAARATAWDTAPASGATLGFALAVIAPLPLGRRRRRLATTDDPYDEPYDDEAEQAATRTLQPV